MPTLAPVSLVVVQRRTMEPSPQVRIAPSPDLSRTLQEARAIADGVSQQLNTAHLLLALFTVPNPAEVLLRERGVDENVLLERLREAGHDVPGAVREVLDQAEQTALRCDARSTNTLHLLVGVLRVRESLAYWLLERSIEPLAPFRNQVMSFVTGILPRRLLAPLQEAKATSRRREERPRNPNPNDDVVMSKHTIVDGDLPKDSAPPPEARPLPASASAVDDAEHPWADEDASAGASQSPPPPPLPPARTTAAKQQKRRGHITRAPTLPPTDYDLDPDRFPWLTALGRNLTSLAALGQLDPAVGRSAEVSQIIDVLGKRRANNPCLVGEPGVGKTAIAEGLAVKLVTGDPEVSSLYGKVIIELDMGRITA
ncbi:MAG: Clp protease N-terminal domain-containing protein, partial [Myxococcota bacterium]